VDLRDTGKWKQKQQELAGKEARRAELKPGAESALVTQEQRRSAIQR